MEYIVKNLSERALNYKHVLVKKVDGNAADKEIYWYEGADNDRSVLAECLNDVMAYAIDAMILETDWLKSHSKELANYCNGACINLLVTE